MILFSLKLTYLKHLSERNYRHVNILGGCTYRRKGSDIILLSNIQEWAYNNYRKSAILKIFIFLLFSNWSYRHSPLVQNFISTSDTRHLYRDAHPDNRRYKGPCSFTQLTPANRLFSVRARFKSLFDLEIWIAHFFGCF